MKTPILAVFLLLPFLILADDCMSFLNSAPIATNTNYARLINNQHITIELQDANYVSFGSSEFWPRVDDFSQLKINNTYNTTWNVKACVTTGPDTSMCANATWATDTTVVSFHTFIITMEQGKITAVEFEDNCRNCDVCVGPPEEGGPKHGTCGVKKADLVENQLRPDVEVHAAWKGTDKNGVALESIGEIFSIYRLYSLTSLGNDLLQWSKLVIHPVRP